MSHSKKSGLNSESARLIRDGVTRLKDPTMKRSDKVLLIIGTIYLISPIDILPDVIFLPFTYTDDAVITGGAVATALVRILWRVAKQRAYRAADKRRRGPTLKG